MLVVHRDGVRARVSRGSTSAENSGRSAAGMSTSEPSRAAAISAAPGIGSKAARTSAVVVDAPQAVHVPGGPEDATDVAGREHLSVADLDRGGQLRAVGAPPQAVMQPGGGDPDRRSPARRGRR